MTGLLALGLALTLLQESSDLQTARSLGVAHYERGEYSLALEALEEVLASDEATARDAFNAGMAALRNQDDARALAHFETARQMDPALLDVDFGLGALFERQGLHPRAAEAFERVVARDPDDPCAWLNLAVVRQAMGEREAAERALDRVVDLGPSRGANFYASALFRKANLLARRGEREAAQRLFEVFETARADVPGEALTPTALQNGVHGRLRAPVPAERGAPKPPRSVALTELTALGAPRCGPDEGAPIPVLGDYDRDGLVDLFLASPCGGSLLYHNEREGDFRNATAELGLQGLGAIDVALFFDDEVSDRPSLYLWSGKGARLLRSREGRYVDETGLAEIPEDARGAVPLDLDRDGQLDLFLLDGTVLRNDGDGTFTRMLEGVGREGQEAVASDFDEDGFDDVLLRLGGEESLLFVNEGGRAVRSLPLRFGGRSLRVLDVDDDGWLDVIGWEDENLVLLRNLQGVLRPAGPVRGLLERRWLVPLRDGVVTSSTLARGPLSGGLLSPAVSGDLDGHGRTTLFVSTEDGRLRRYRERDPAPGWLRVALEGKRANRSAVGAVVEVKAGLLYRKEAYRGLPLVFDTNGREKVDVVRVTWTDGVIQNVLDVTTGQAIAIAEEDRQTSSCPFLYAWDGERFRFLTDVVGRAPLGEVEPDGTLVTPNPDDYVRIAPGAMRAREGRYLLQITEELRELAALDGVELLAVDHPADVDVFADERFHAPPFEGFRLHGISELRAPLSATDAAGADVLDLVRAQDGRYLAPPERHAVRGFAQEHALVLEPPFGDDVEGAVLLLSGFVDWPSSSSMRALAANETFAPRSPSLQVDDGRGGWSTLVADLGLPSGIDRTLVVELPGPLRRLRVVTNFDVSWDRAAFGRPADPAVFPTRALPLVSADLHYRGFSAVETSRDAPDRYDYDRSLPAPPWEGAPGRYTPFGDVVELVGGIDERLVVMAPGDELSLAFDAEVLPELPKGETRTFFLRVRGWAKDRDPNTRFSGSVNPLPVARDDPSRSRDRAPLVPRLAPPR